MSVLTGNPITGRVVLAAMTPPKCAALPAAQMITSIPFALAFAAKVCASSGVRWAEMTLTSVSTPNFFMTEMAGFTTSRSDLLPIKIPIFAIFFTYFAYFAYFFACFLAVFGLFLPVFRLFYYLII
jgi:hypothetical protein